LGQNRFPFVDDQEVTLVLVPAQGFYLDHNHAVYFLLGLVIQVAPLVAVLQHVAYVGESGGKGLSKGLPEADIQDFLIPLFLD